MMKKMIAAIMIVTPVYAQTEFSVGTTQTLMAFSGTSVYFNWPEIKKCAKERIEFLSADDKGGNDMLSKEWQTYEYNFHRISSCRLALAARGEGWKESGSNLENPYPPEPMLIDGVH